MSDDIRELAPTGRLRGGTVIAPVGSASFAVQDASGAARGVTVDLLNYVAGRVKLALELQIFPNSGEATNAVAGGACDIAFMPVDAERMKKVAFGPAYYLIESAYLVPAGSTLTQADEVNRPGMRIIAIANTTTMRSARRTAPLASVREVPTVDEMVALARAGEGDAFALSRDSFLGLMPQLPGARVLSGNIQVTELGVAVPPGRPAALKLASALIDEAKRNGVVRRALDAGGFAGAPVAP